MKHLLWSIAALALLLGFVAETPAHAANCAGYTYILTNGQTADATQVMSNFNTIMSCANSNLAKSGANSDITSLSGLGTPLSVSQGGTGLTSLANAWANSNLATMANNTVKGNISGGSAAPSDISLSSLETALQPYLPFDFYTFVGGLTGDAWTLAAYQPSTGLVLTTAKSSCTYGTAATGSTTYTLKDNGVSIGTAVFTAGNCTIAITSSPYTVTAGHTLSIAGPATGDATLANIGMTFGGTRN